MLLVRSITARRCLLLEFDPRDCVRFRALMMLGLVFAKERLAQRVDG
jgi:hypothetical protein